MLPASEDKNCRWIYRCARCSTSVGIIDTPERLPSVAGPLGADGTERVLLCIACYDEFKGVLLWPWLIQGTTTVTAETT